jgi:glycosyltransferase involved in cell wall biosynthesis
MRVLMFGWEFPPRVSGGLGVACEGLVRGLIELETDVTLVLPRGYPEGRSGRLRIVASERPRTERTVAGDRSVRIRRIPSALRPYGPGLAEILPASPASTPDRAAAAEREGDPYGPDLEREVARYAAAAARIAAREACDVIHAHDWLTFPAGLEARRVLRRPLVLHVHSTELDRGGPSGNPFIREVERRSLAEADRVIAVSGYTAGLLEREYGVSRERLRVVHNAIDAAPGDPAPERRRAPIVLFAGRITRQKGPDYFVEAAARVAAERADVRFVVAGAGDLEAAMAERVRSAGLSRRFRFPGFLPPEALDRLYARARVFVLPSLSEPFGLAALEALRHGTPAIVTRSAGVSEVVRHVLRVRFGDVEDLASKILSVLAFEPLRRSLSVRGRAEVGRLSWRDAAARCVAVYQELVGESGAAS